MRMVIKLLIHYITRCQVFYPLLEKYPWARSEPTLVV